MWNKSKLCQSLYCCTNFPHSLSPHHIGEIQNIFKLSAHLRISHVDPCEGIRSAFFIQSSAGQCDICCYAEGKQSFCTVIHSHDVNLNVDSSDAWRKLSRNIAQNQWRSRTCENSDHFEMIDCSFKINNYQHNLFPTK